MVKMKLIDNYDYWGRHEALGILILLVGEYIVRIPLKLTMHNL